MSAIGWVWMDGCEVRLCVPCARVRPCVPRVPCVSRLPPVSFYRYNRRPFTRRRVVYPVTHRDRPGPGHTPYGRLPMRRLRIRAGATIIAQHKPISFLSPSTDPRGNKRYARDLLMHTNLRGHWPWEGEPRDLPGLSCCGRLDADSSGLLLWTDDHDLAQFIIGPNTPVEKEYLVRVSGQQHYSEATLADSLALLRSGITLDGEPLRAADVSWANADQLKFVLREGRHRQIRRMCLIVGLHVEALKRVRIGKLRLASLSIGKWTPLSPANAASLLMPSRRPPAQGHVAAEAESAVPVPRRQSDAHETDSGPHLGFSDTQGYARPGPRAIPVRAVGQAAHSTKTSRLVRRG